MSASTRAILDAAVAGLNGSPRSGQADMAAAIADAFENREHLLVQAGTGTGKSLGYLAPALARLASDPRERIVVATATLALQAQLATSDIPAALDATEQATGRRPVHAILKGRGNYACLHRALEGTGSEQETLLGSAALAQGLRDSGADATSVLGAEVVALREWIEQERESGGVGDRDDAPTHTAAAWAQVSVPVRECLGPTCAFASECFAEQSRERARGAQLVVTNHALLAIDALHGATVLPEHDFLVIDEAHELTARVTGAASHELSPQQVERVARRCLPHLSDDDLAVDFLDLGDALKQVLEDAPLERVQDPEAPLIAVLQRIREVARSVVSALTGEDPQVRQAAAAVREVLDVAQDMAALRPSDVLWVSERERFGRWLVVAPLNVAGLLREHVLAVTPTVLTSATLKLGGGFEPTAGAIGLRREDRLEGPVADAPEADTDGDAQAPKSDADGDGAGVPEVRAWRALDVGSPFDYARQGILYVAAHLPPPGREGISAEALTEVAELVWASGGRALGLFASQRNAEAAARHCRAELPQQTILCQGDAQLSELTRRFVAEPSTSLFGTLSLWQGVDVPGETCQVVIIDKIPFPRPDDPLMQARQRAVAESGGNGFMAVAATHAALLLAQGSGRLIRRTQDRGVVAVLDPRLRTARYGGFLRASLPPFWATTDREVAVRALRRLAAG